MRKDIEFVKVDIGEFIDRKMVEVRLKPIEKKFEELEKYKKSAREAKERQNYGCLFSLCMSFLGRYPDCVVASFDLAEVYLRAGKGDRARQVLEALCRYYPKDRHFLMAQIELMEYELMMERKRA